MEGFARALRKIPTIIADNGGYDSAELVSGLIVNHSTGNQWDGLNMNLGVIANMKELGITESFKVKSQIITSATEAAEMILRVDEIVKSAPRRRDADPRMG